MTIEFVRTIGRLDSDDENYLFYLPEDICVDERGYLYVLDSGNSRIQVFNDKAEYVKTIGRKGQGELLIPNRLGRDSRVNLYVFETWTKKMKVLTPDGKELGSFPSDRSSFNFQVTPDDRIVISGLKFSYLTGAFRHKTKIRKAFIFQEVKDDGALIGEFGMIDKIAYPQSILSNFATDLAIDKEGNLYLSYRGLNKIEKYSPEGSLLLKISRKLNYDTGSDETDRSIYRNSGKKEPIVATGIAADAKNRIWVATLNRQETEDEKAYITSMNTSRPGGGINNVKQIIKGNTDILETDLYDLELYDGSGALLEKIPLTRHCDRLWIFGRRLFILDKLRGMNFREYRIIEK